MYKLIRPIIFFLLNPEQAHHITLKFFKAIHYIPGMGWFLRKLFCYNNPKLKREVFGIKFNNPVGLAAGFDKNGNCYNELSNLGFSFIEIGSITPTPQPGNPKPRCFRLPKDGAIINRFGINNNGVKYTVEYIKKHYPKCVLGASLSKCTASSNEEAPKDLEKSFAILYDFVDYFALNVSCPNVKNLCQLQDISFLSEIIDRLLTLRRYYDDYRPILLKVSPDLSHEQIDDITDYCLRSGIDGIVAGNTTRSREGLTSISAEKIEEIGNGGMSGAPVHKKNLELVRYIHEKSEGRLPIIGVGGIMSPADAKAMLDAGASLVEIYSGFIYEGPGLVKRIIKHLEP